jgi:hypothetical protein
MIDPFADHLAVKRLQEELARWSYKPGWSMRIEPDPSPWVPAMLIVRFEAPDSRDPSNVIQLEQRQIVDMGVVEGFVPFGVWVQSMLRRMEFHESQEWLRRDGEIFEDPHKEKP